MNMKGLKVVDQRGNPVIISAVVTFVAMSARKARIDVQHPLPHASWNPHVSSGTFLKLQAEAVLKQVTSSFPYEAPPGMPSLQTQGEHIQEMLVQKLQDRVSLAGANILTFDLVDLSYAPEIAQSMLLRQQAAALVDARKLIVHASLEMVHDAVQLLDDKGISPSTKVKEGIVSNLLTVICSRTGVTPLSHRPNQNLLKTFRSPLGSSRLSYVKRAKWLSGLEHRVEPTSFPRALISFYD